LSRLRQLVIKSGSRLLTVGLDLLGRLIPDSQCGFPVWLDARARDSYHLICIVQGAVAI
jgi:hypothetical protein